MDYAKPTIKQSTSHNIITNFKPDVHESYSNTTDCAKPTIKQATSHSIITNFKPDAYETYASVTDNARSTIKETTEATQYIGVVNDNYINASYNEFDDTAKVTIKETTAIIPQPIANANRESSNVYSRTVGDIAKNTIKQSTIDNNYIGNVRTDVNAQMSHDSANNMTPNICREATVTFNRPANGKADLHGPYINRETVEFADTIHYSYAGNPFKALDHSIAPTLSNSQIQDINTIKTNTKPTNQTVSYYINSNYINTLKNNPFVNDLYHQKNYELL
jgi:hypothetical protein